jgi:hypothetical protein
VNVESLLAQLSKVRQKAPGEWLACCPAHQDRTPSLAIKDCGDGRILVHCHAECMPEDVVGAVGLTLADLMPEKPIQDAVKRSPFSARTALEALSYQANIVAVAASMMSQGETLSLKDKDRLFEIAGNIARAYENVTN